MHSWIDQAQGLTLHIRACICAASMCMSADVRQPPDEAPTYLSQLGWCLISLPPVGLWALPSSCPESGPMGSEALGTACAAARMHFCA